jgi:hypothetical protein
VNLHFALNDTSTHPDGSLIEGGQLHRFFQSTWDALDAMDVAYTVGRQPAKGSVNVYPNNRRAYTPGSARLDRESVGVSHGIASKTYVSSHYRFFRHVIIPGQAHWDELRRVRFPARKINVLGYPKLDLLFRGEVDGSGVFGEDGRIRVLYAPTHEGGSERNSRPTAPGSQATSWNQRDEVLALLDEDVFDVVTAPHPRHHPAGKATFAEYVNADVVIADGGSTIYEALVLGKPVVLPSWLTRERNETRAVGRTLESRVYREGIGYHVDDPRGFADSVRRAAEQGQREKDVAFAETVVAPEHRGVGGKRWAEFLAGLDIGEVPQMGRVDPRMLQHRTRAGARVTRG